jgi:rhamnogalacturonyl hydrolase YesR
MKLNYDKAQLEAAVDKVAERTMNMDMTWDWPCGVAYYGITEAYEATGNKKYLDMVKERVDELISLGLPDFTVNTCAMGHVLLTLYKETGDETYKKIIDDKLDYLTNHALRFGDHVLQHTVSANNDFPEQCWADTLFMAAFFMLRAGVMFERPELVEDALNQWYWHIQYLQNERTGLWRTILDDPESYEEVSASAGIAAAMVLKGNPLHIKYINKAITGILENISEDGKVMNVSGGTAVMKDREGYRSISKRWIQGWGQGMALAFFSTVLNYEKFTGDGAL